MAFTHLHTRSWFSFLSGGSPPEKLAMCAREQGFSAIGITDVNGVYGAVRFQHACKEVGLHPVVGAEVTVGKAPLVLLCQTREGYANLCRLLTAAHLHDRKAPSVDLETVDRFKSDLICLTHGREGALWKHVSQHQRTEAHDWIEQLQSVFGHQLFIELCHGHRQRDQFIIQRLHQLAREHHIPCVASNDVRYATPGDYRLYDIFSCTRHKIQISQPHPLRPHNAEQYLKSEQQLRKLIPFPEAFDNTQIITHQCNVDLLPEEITPPGATIPEGLTGESFLTGLCYQALKEKYSENSPRALAQLEKELGVITSLDLQEFFLVVREVVVEANRRGIRCAGRGSAANSIVAYLLGITAVDPIEHNLLFERFLHGGRKGTPNIDIDFDSDRRDEIIEWMEERFGIQQTAMTATLITYQARSSLRDVAKTLGWPLTMVDQLTKLVPGHGIDVIPEYADQIRCLLGPSPLVEYLFHTVRLMKGCPRHLGLHSGGMVLSRKDLSYFSPTQVSANGVKELQFDKYDIEAELGSNGV